MKKIVYFNGELPEGCKDALESKAKETLGGKGAGLCLMKNLGL